MANTGPIYQDYTLRANLNEADAEHAGEKLGEAAARGFGRGGSRLQQSTTRGAREMLGLPGSRISPFGAVGTPTQELITGVAGGMAAGSLGAAVVGGAAGAGIALAVQGASSALGAAMNLVTEDLKRLAEVEFPRIVMAFRALEPSQEAFAGTIGLARQAAAGGFPLRQGDVQEIFNVNLARGQREALGELGVRENREVQDIMQREVLSAERRKIHSLLDVSPLYSALLFGPIGVELQLGGRAAAAAYARVFE